MVYKGINVLVSVYRERSLIMKALYIRKCKYGVHIFYQDELIEISTLDVHVFTGSVVGTTGTLHKCFLFVFTVYYEITYFVPTVQ